MPCAPDLHFISLCWLKVCWSGYRITSRCCQSLFWFTESATQGVIRFKPETPSQLLKEMRGERDRGQKGELQLGMTRKQDFWRVITFRKPNVICEFLPTPCKEKKKSSWEAKTSGHVLTWWSGAHRNMGLLGCPFGFGVFTWLSCNPKQDSLIIRSAFGIRCIAMKKKNQSKKPAFSYQNEIFFSTFTCWPAHSSWGLQKRRLSLDHEIQQTSLNRSTGSWSDQKLLISST